MAKKKSNNPDGLKHFRKIDDEKWNQLCKILALKPTLKDCMGILDVHSSTVENEIKRRTGMSFSEFRLQKMAPVKQQLIRKAIEMALHGNVVMLIFCLKNLCNWTDKIQQVDHEDIEDIEWITD